MRGPLQPPANQYSLLFPSQSSLGLTLPFSSQIRVHHSSSIKPNKIIDTPNPRLRRQHNALRNTPTQKFGDKKKKKTKMEKTSNKQEKKKMAIRIGSGGGGGGGVRAVIVLGGALAIATLASVSAIRLTRRKPTNKTHPPPIPIDQSEELEKKSSKDGTSEGFRALLHESPSPVHELQSDGTTNIGVIQIDSTSLVFTGNLILDNDISGQKQNPAYGDQENLLLSDNSKTEGSKLLIHHGVNGQEFLFPVCVNPSILNPLENEVIEDLRAVEVIEDMKEDKAIEAPYAGPIAEDDNSKMQLIEDAQIEEYNDGENIVEKGEEAVETAQVDQIAMELDSQMQLSKEEDKENDVGIDEDDIAEKDEEAVETAQVDQIAMEPNPQMQSSKEEDHSENDVGVEAEEDIARVESAQVDQIAIELDPKMQLCKQEDNKENENGTENAVGVDDDDEEEDIAEKREEDSSEGTGDSSMESNADPVWPVESMQELSIEIKGLKIDDQKLGEDIEDDTTLRTEDNGWENSIESSSKNDDIGKSTTLNKGDRRKILKLINQPQNSSDLRTWIWLMLLLPVLLLVAVPLLLSLTQIVKLCLIIFFIMILFKFRMFEKLS